MTAAGFVPYYSYSGALAVSGTVGAMTTSGTTQTFYYSLSGADPACASGAGTAGNSCGIHIHSGTTCAGDAGGHYYNEETITDDPWASIRYGGKGTVSGTADGVVSVDTGLQLSELAGHAFIVHGWYGERVACALLAAGADVNARSLMSGSTPLIVVACVVPSHLSTPLNAALLRGGATLDRDEIQKRTEGERGGGWTPYLERVYDAGGWKGYAQAHRASLVAMLAPKLRRLPADVIPLVVDFWAHVGMSLPPPPPLPHGRLLDDGSELLWGEEWRITICSKPTSRRVHHTAGDGHSRRLAPAPPGQYAIQKGLGGKPLPLVEQRACQ